MEWLPAATSLGPMAATIGLSYVLNLAARKIAPSLGLVDKPDGGRKTHQKVTPVMGGVAYVLATLIVVGLALVLQAEWLESERTRQLVFSLGASAIGFCLLGVCDDRWPMSPRVKLLGQILASLPFVVLNGVMSKVGLIGWEIPLGAAGGLVTVLWLVACSNIVNLIDGLDGLAGSIGVVVMITIAGIFGIQGHRPEAMLTLVIAGGLIGFLGHNLPPAKIFMGDAGSMTLGFLAGALSIQASSKTATTFTLGVPVVLMSIPIFDTAMAILRRRLTGRSIGEGDRGHIHHRLQDRGLTRQQALLAISGLTMIMAGAALLSVLFESEMVGMAICLGVLGVLILSRVFGYYETSLVFRHLRELGDLMVDTSGMLKTRLLLARLDDLGPEQKSQLWEEIVKHASHIKAARLEYQCYSVSQDRTTTRLSWENIDHEVESSGPRWQIACQIPRENGLTAHLEASGLLSSTDAPPRVDELFRLFAKVGMAFPTQDGAGSSLDVAEPFDDDIATLHFPAPPLPVTARRAA